MFGIGMPELIVILAVALIFIGPKKLPDLAKSLGKALGEFKRATNDLKQSFEQEAGLDEVRENFRKTHQDLQSALDIADESPIRPSDAAAETTGDAVTAESDIESRGDSGPSAPPDGTPPGESRITEPRKRADGQKGDLT